MNFVLNSKARILAGCLILLLSVEGVQALDLDGFVGVEGIVFPNESPNEAQQDHGLSVSLQPEVRNQWQSERSQSDYSFTFIPFVRWDSEDDERSHGDIRELNLLVAKGDWEFQAGLGKVFWGVTESRHLVDIINQTDAVESSDGEQKLGQPMLRMTRVLGNGALDFFILPGFRERTFSGEAGRFGPPLQVDTDNPLYESSDEDDHIDFALRWSQSVGAVDFGLSWFEGTGRDPTLVPMMPAGSPAPVLTPFYPQIEQAGLDLQYTGEAILWKLEAIHRSSTEESYNAATGGFEYTFFSLREGALDLGVLAELHHDSRGEASPDPFQNDLFFGGRLTLNDVNSSTLLAGAIVDLDHQGKSFRIEASRRIGDRIKVNLELQNFWNISEADPLFGVRDSDYLKFEWRYYF